MIYRMNSFGSTNQLYFTIVCSNVYYIMCFMLLFYCLTGEQTVLLSFRPRLGLDDPREHLMKVSFDLALALDLDE